MIPYSREQLCQAASFVLTALVLIIVLDRHLLVPLLAGLLVHELVLSVTPFVERRISTRPAKLLTVILFSGLVIALIVGGAVALVEFFRSDTGDVGHLLHKVSGILDRVRGEIPPALAGYLPIDPDDLRERILEWLRGHIADLQTMGTHTLVIFAETLIALVIGAVLVLREVTPGRRAGPLARALTERSRRFAAAFRQVALSQMSISLLNTTFTALYLLVLLPLAGIHLPLVKTLIAVTFIAGLLPVVGNLISNSIVVLVSLGYSIFAATASLAFLVLIHKLEYFLNARIVGTRIHAAIWELLIAMMVLEALFGVHGLVAAPIYYAYAKSELAEAGLI
jgi:predicted PurR-regulated permease PerM